MQFVQLSASYAQYAWPTYSNSAQNKASIDTPYSSTSPRDQISGDDYIYHTSTTYSPIISAIISGARYSGDTSHPCCPCRCPFCLVQNVLSCISNVSLKDECPHSANTNLSSLMNRLVKLTLLLITLPFNFSISIHKLRSSIFSYQQSLAFNFLCNERGYILNCDGLSSSCFILHNISFRGWSIPVQNVTGLILLYCHTLIALKLAILSSLISTDSPACLNYFNLPIGWPFYSMIQIVKIQFQYDLTLVYLISIYGFKYYENTLDERRKQNDVDVILLPIRLVFICFGYQQSQLSQLIGGSSACCYLLRYLLYYNTDNAFTLCLFGLQLRLAVLYSGANWFVNLALLAVRWCQQCLWRLRRGIVFWKGYYVWKQSSMTFLTNCALFLN